MLLGALALLAYDTRASSRARDLRTEAGTGRVPGPAGCGAARCPCPAVEAVEGVERAPMSVRAAITSHFEEVAREQKRELVPLSDDLKLLDSGLDSLSFAIIVARLEDQFGVDPFSAEAVDLPVTFGDFVRLYEDSCR